jgi:DNA-binding MarR family transcriptional regulator
LYKVTCQNRDVKMPLPRPPLGYVLARTHHALRAAHDEALRPFDLTMPQVAILVALVQNPGLSVAELARRAFMKPQSMGELLATLENRGLVRRRPHPEHGRVLPAELTPAGHKAVEGCRGLASQVESRMLSRLSSAERRSLANLLERCLDGLMGEAARGESS